MLSAIGLAALVIGTAVVAFYGSFLAMDKMRLWKGAGLGAIIPMLIVAGAVSVFSAAFALWLVTV